MGDMQRLSPGEQIEFAREQYEQARDFTVAVEEEFAVLDPETLALTNRFEELQAAAKNTPLEPHLVGELIASEVEIRTGRSAPPPRRRSARRRGAPRARSRAPTAAGPRSG